MANINITPLSEKILEAPYISIPVLELIRSNIAIGKKTLLFYNRRGTARAWICEDCGYFEKCPHCDIALAYHTTPNKRLVCHQCNTIVPFPVSCSRCHGTHISPVGVGIERVFSDLQNLLGPTVPILRIDSDNPMKISEMFEAFSDAGVILATNMGATLTDETVGSVVFLSFEINLSIPEYDIEEQIYDEILFYKKQDIDIYIQTYTPEHPLLTEILTGNQQSFFRILQQERKLFHYPPYAEIATLRVHHPSKERVRSMIVHIANKIQPYLQDGIFITVDSDLWERRSGDWMQKIIIKGKNIAPIIGELEIEVVRNRSVSLEWN